MRSSNESMPKKKILKESINLIGILKLRFLGSASFDEKSWIRLDNTLILKRTMTSFKKKINYVKNWMIY